MRILAPSLLVALAGLAHAADDVSRDLMLRFNERALRAEKALEAHGTEAAIAIYRGALEETEQFGRVHLRLGQLYQQQGDLPQAAAHFRDCDRDERVDSMDRELICRRAFEEITAPLTVTGLPPEGAVVILEPRAFAGPLKSGDRLPMGRIRVAVDAPDRIQREAEFEHTGKAPWSAEIGMARPRGPLIPGDFIVEGDPPPTEDAPPGVSASGGGNGLPVWPAYAVGGLGAALVGGGLYLGFSNNAELDDIRARQRNGGCGLKFCGSELADAENTATVADALWISGSALLTGAIVWWLVADGDGE